jgi:ankyrin repeat protein
MAAAESTEKTTSPDQPEPSGTSSPSSSFASTSERQMDRQLLKACSQGDIALFRQLTLDDPIILMSVTNAGNNCLHLAAMLGHHEFAKEVWSREPSLLLGTNKDGETPLVAALAAANASLASDMIAAATQRLQPDIEGGKPLNEMLLKFDIRGNSVLHHAMRNSFEDLAVQLLDIEPRLSEQVNKCNESPMHMASRRGYSKILERLINIPSSADSGPCGHTALHAAVEAGHTGYIYNFQFYA